MGPSSNKSWIVTLDRAALGGLALGMALYVMPFWAEGRLRPAFWLTLLSTLLHVYTSHKRFAPPKRFASPSPVTGIESSPAEINPPGHSTSGAS